MTRGSSAKAFFLTAAFAVSACAANNNEPTIPGVFNTALTLFESVVPDQPLLFPEGYSLDDVDGEDLGVTDCNALAALDRDKVAERDISYYLSYRADCMGATAYLAGADATKSYLRGIDIIDVVPLLSATIRPRVSSDTDLSSTWDLGVEGLTLAESEQDLSLNVISTNSVTAKLDIFEADYETIGLRDVNGDGIEDMILRLNYAVIQGSARGTKVFFLTRLSADAPFEEITHSNLPSLATFSN